LAHGFTGNHFAGRGEQQRQNPGRLRLELYHGAIAVLSSRERQRAGMFPKAVKHLIG